MCKNEIVHIYRTPYYIIGGRYVGICISTYIVLKNFGEKKKTELKKDFILKNSCCLFSSRNIFFSVITVSEVTFIRNHGADISEYVRHVSRSILTLFLSYAHNVYCS